MRKIFAILLLSSMLLIAKEVKDINQEAITYLESKNPTKAYEVLFNLYKKGLYDNETLFLLGTSAKLKGDFKNAIKYFELLLSKDKRANRVRLDLAAIYYRIGKLKKAKDLLLIVKASHPPKKVGDNIDMFLATIDKGIPKLWSIRVAAGWMYDSNANAGPDTDTILMYNLPFTLSPDAKESSDTALRYSFGFNYIKQLNKLAWQNSFDINVVDYNKLDALDSKNISLSTALITKKGRFTYSVPLIGNILIIGHDKKYYSTSIGAAPQVNYQYNNKISFNLSVSYQSKKYYKNSDRKSHSITFSPSSRILLDRSGYIRVGGYYGEESSKTETYGNYARGVNINYYKAFNQNLNANIGFSASRVNYKGVEQAYDKSRRDISRSYNGSLSYFIEKIKATLSLDASYTTNSSNILMYKYDRKQIGINISKSF